MSFSRALMALVLALSFRLFAQGVMISTVAIGNPVNAPDTRYAFGGPGYGSVGYSFRIGKLEISNSQYVDFLNAVAASDPYGLYNPEMGTDSWGGIVRSGSPGNFTYAVKAGVTGEGLGVVILRTTTNQLCFSRGSTRSALQIGFITARVVVIQKRVHIRYWVARPSLPTLTSSREIRVPVGGYPARTNGTRPPTMTPLPKFITTIQPARAVGQTITCPRPIPVIR